jgi:hypothetical protein
MKFSVITNLSVGLDFRHPKKFSGESLQNADMLLMTGFASQSPTLPYFQQYTQFLNTLLTCLSSSLNAKVLLPCQPTFLIEILDLLVHKVDEQVKIVFMAEAAQALIEYASINMEYLNPMLQNKVYKTENPFNITNLMKSGRLQICKDIQEYLHLKKSQSFDEF